MPSINAISIDKLARLVGTPKCPVLIDVQTDKDVAADPRLIPSAIRRPWAQASDWAQEFVGQSAIVICQKGLKLSQGVAAWLRHEGIPADSLEGGALAWAQAGLPMVPEAALPPRDGQGRTVWVTRARPKVDRIACPWLIRRFVDPHAVILFVTPSEVAAVAQRFGAPPFDIEGEDVFWSHRGEKCTFDTMVEEFGLATEPLLHLATIVRGADTARMALSIVYALYGKVGIVSALFFGLKAAVLAVVLQAVVRIGGKALKNRIMISLAAAAFVAIFFFGVPFPIIVLTAGIIGFFGGRAGVPAFQVGGGHSASKEGKQVADVDALLGEELPEHARPKVARALWVSVICLALWLVPVAALLVTLGPDNVFSRIATFFSTMAVVTFGGAYAVLAYVAQQAVENYGWLQPGEMLDGLGMAETTPGPLIMVLQFVGFMGAFRDPGVLSPLMAGVLGGLLATWVTFVPCFLFIFLGAPFIEVLRGNQALHGALSAITAAVVGVVLNLAIWFAVHTVFRETWPVRSFGLSFDAPVLASVDPWALLLSVAAVIAMFRFKVGMIPTLTACSAAGIVLYLAGAIS